MSQNTANEFRTYVRGAWKEVELASQTGGDSTPDQTPEVGVAKSLYRLAEVDIDNHLALIGYENGQSVCPKYKKEFKTFVKEYMNQHHFELLEMLDLRFNQNPDPSFNSVRKLGEINFTSHRNQDPSTLWRIAQDDVDSAVDALGFNFTPVQMEYLYEDVRDNYGVSWDEELRSIIMDFAINRLKELEEVE